MSCWKWRPFCFCFIVICKVNSSSWRNVKLKVSSQCSKQWEHMEGYYHRGRGQGAGGGGEMGGGGGENMNFGRGTRKRVEKMGGGGKKWVAVGALNPGGRGSRHTYTHILCAIDWSIAAVVELGKLSATVHVRAWCLTLLKTKCRNSTQFYKISHIHVLHCWIHSNSHLQAIWVQAYFYQWLDIRFKSSHFTGHYTLQKSSHSNSE